MEKGVLLVISGPSGAGKGTICKALLEKNNDIELSISATTRGPRKGEEHGKNYFFITKEEFEGKIKEGDFLEHATYCENHYGTPKDFVLNKLDEGKDVLLEIDIQGALKVKETYPDGVFIFIMPPSMEELKRRIENRGTEKKEIILKRMETAYKEINYIFKYDYGVLNDEVDLAVEKIESIIRSEKCKVNRLSDTIKALK